MLWNWSLALGTLASLATGPFVLVASPAVSGEQSPDVVRIPIGNVGDQFVFTLRGEAAFPDEENDSGPQAPPILDRYEDSFAYKILEPRFSRGSDGSRYWSLPVARNKSGPHHSGPTDHSSEILSIESIRLSDRRAIQNELHEKLEDSSGSSADSQRGFGDSMSPLPGAAMQGRNLRMGQDLANEIPLGTQDSLFWMPWNEPFEIPLRPDPGTEPPNWNVRCQVDRTGTIDGQPAVGVSTFVTYDFVDEFGTVHVTSKETAWWSSIVPYPVRIESMVRGDGPGYEVWHERTFTLTRFLQGSGPAIPWGETTKESYTWERSSLNAPAPASGTGSDPAFGIDDALKSAKTDAAAKRFQDWFSAHPQARLIAVEARVADRPAMGLDAPVEWQFGFASPSGDGWVIFVEGLRPGLPARVTDKGSAPSDPYDPRWLPENPPTVHAVGELWKELRGPRFQSAPMNYVRWGFAIVLREQEYRINATHYPEPGNFQLRVGFSISEAQYSGPLGLPVPRSDSGYAFSLLFVNMTQPEILYIWESEVSGSSSSGVPPIDFRPTMKSPSFLSAGRAPLVTPTGAAAVSLSALATFLLLYFLPATKFLATRMLGILPGYAKLRRNELLDHHLREKILEKVRADPGANASELRRSLNAGWGTVVHHLATLERNGFLVSVADGRHRRFFAVGDVAAADRSKLIAMRHPRTSAIFEAIREQPGMIRKDLADRLGSSAPALCWHLRRLVAAGILRRERKGRMVHYYPRG